MYCYDVIEIWLFHGPKLISVIMKCATPPGLLQEAHNNSVRLVTTIKQFKTK